MYAPHNKVDNLIATIDYNGQQIDGPVNAILNLLSLKAKYESFGWIILEQEAGNNLEAMVSTLQEAKSLLGNGKPVMILMKTEMGFGVDFMMHSHKWHGIPPNDEQLAAALGQLESDLVDY
jgi:transketolase